MLHAMRCMQCAGSVEYRRLCGWRY